MFLSPLFAAALALSRGEPDGWVCDGSARGLRQSHLSVRLAFRPDGSVRARTVTWSPKLVREASSVAGLSQHALWLWIIYRDAARPDQPGRPTDVAVTVESGASPALSHAMNLTLRLDSGRAWTTSVNLRLAGGDSNADLISTSSTAEIASNGERGKPMNIDLLDAIEVAHSVDVTLQDTAGAPYAMAKYHIAADNRRCLTRAAWATAERMARDPTHSDCYTAPSTIFGQFHLPPDAGC